jgi:hypothetical protein
MSASPNGIETRADAISLLRRIDGREVGEIGEWDIDDFASAPHSDRMLNACRLRVRDELIDLLASKNPTQQAKISPLIDELIKDLECNAAD